MRSSLGARALLGLVGATVLLATGVPFAPPRAIAAVPDLTLVTDARYEVRPEERLVHVTVAITATNHLVDTATRRFYFDRAFLAVLPGTSRFKISGGGGTPTVTVSAAKSDHTLLRIDFGARLAAGKSTTFQLQFDLVDPGGAGNREVRIGTAIVSFPVWAYGTDSTPGSRVSVILPADYQVEFLAGGMTGPEAGAAGTAVFASEALEAPLSFYAYLVGDRPGAYRDQVLSIPVSGASAQLVVQAWEDDEEWGIRVADLLTRGLPELGRSIGLAWPETDVTTVREALSRTTGGYAGLFDPAKREIDIAYYAGSGVVLHEAAHGWFNGALLADRWANEAFASLYGSAVAVQLAVDANEPVLTEELEAARIPLNEWGAIGAEAGDVESYGYGASLALARLIAERAGDGALREVWAKASARVGAYQPVGGDAGSAPIDGNESAAGPPDWRGLLDLLEETAGTPFDDLWNAWVVREADRPLLAERAATRQRYDTLVAAAGDWRLPRSIRDAMRVWQFDTAADLFDQATDVLDLRSAIAREASLLGLDPPGTLRPLFERAEGFAGALTEGAAEVDTLSALRQAETVRLREPGPIEALGLIGTEPAKDLDAARNAFEAGELTTANERAAAATVAWSTASEVGGGRALSGVLLAAAMLIVLVLIARRGPIRSGRPGLGHVRQAHPIAPSPGESYATLADHPTDTEAGDPEERR